jgi:hypothetical protein
MSRFVKTTIELSQLKKEHFLETTSLDESTRHPLFQGQDLLAATFAGDPLLMELDEALKAEVPLTPEQKSDYFTRLIERAKLFHPDLNLVPSTYPPSVETLSKLQSIYTSENNESVQKAFSKIFIKVAQELYNSSSDPATNKDLRSTIVQEAKTFDEFSQEYNRRDLNRSTLRFRKDGKIISLALQGLGEGGGPASFEVYEKKLKEFSEEHSLGLTGAQMGYILRSQNQSFITGAGENLLAFSCLDYGLGLSTGYHFTVVEISEKSVTLSEGRYCSGIDMKNAESPVDYRNFSTKTADISTLTEDKFAPALSKTVNLTLSIIHNPDQWSYSLPKSLGAIVSDKPLLSEAAILQLEELIFLHYGAEIKPKELEIYSSIRNFTRDQEVEFLNKYSEKASLSEKAKKELLSSFLYKEERDKRDKDAKIDAACQKARQIIGKETALLTTEKVKELSQRIKTELFGGRDDLPYDKMVINAASEEGKKFSTGATIYYAGTRIANKVSRILLGWGRDAEMLGLRKPYPGPGILGRVWNVLYPPKKDNDITYKKTETRAGIDTASRLDVEPVPSIARERANALTARELESDFPSPSTRHPERSEGSSITTPVDSSDATSTPDTTSRVIEAAASLEATSPTLSEHSRLSDDSPRIDPVPLTAVGSDATSTPDTASRLDVEPVLEAAASLEATSPTLSADSTSPSSKPRTLASSIPEDSITAKADTKPRSTSPGRPGMELRGSFDKKLAPAAAAGLRSRGSGSGITP